MKRSVLHVRILIMESELGVVGNEVAGNETHWK